MDRPLGWTNRKPGIINPIVAKAGWLQSRGIKGEAVVIYRNPLITKDLESSGFPVG